MSGHEYDAACKRALLAEGCWVDFQSDQLARERVESMEDIHCPEYADAYIEFSLANREVLVWDEARYCYITDYNRYMSILRRKADVIKGFEHGSAKYNHMYYSYIDIYGKANTIRDEYHKVFGVWLPAPAVHTSLNPPE